MDLAFTTLDVFTAKQLEGNPLAVVRVPASQRARLSQSMKQKIAQEFNLSETVFLHDGTFACYLTNYTIDTYAYLPQALETNVHSTALNVLKLTGGTQIRANQAQKRAI
jgi:hypothetical protein